MDEYEIDLDSLLEGIEAINEEAAQAWSIGALEGDGPRGELWDEAALKLEELAEVYARIYASYSGTLETPAEA